MSFMAAAVVGSAVIGAGTTALASSAASKASAKATAAQSASQEQALAEQRRQFDETRTLLQPYVAAGSPALAQQMAALGLSGPEAQQAYVAQQEQSPLFQAIARQGEEALLQKASATGGLRGGNVQGALAQFRPSLLNQFLEQQYGRLGNIAAAGQNAATGTGTFGQQATQNISGLLQGQGQIAAGGALAQGQAQANMFGGIGQAASTIGNFAASGGFGGRPGFSMTTVPQFATPQFAAPASLPSGPVAPLFGGP
jgi:hypothetical protein